MSKAIWIKEDFGGIIVAQDRIMFIPWNRTDVANAPGMAIPVWEHQASQNNAAHTHHNRRWTVIYADHAGGNALNMRTSCGARIVIEGHGAPGVDALGPPPGSTGANLTAAGIVAALQGQGLPLGYIGTIVLDACSSGLAGPAGPLVAIPLAQRLATAMGAAGYRHPKVMGYRGFVRLEYGSFNADNPGLHSQYEHRSVRLPGPGHHVVKSKNAQFRFRG